MILAIVPRDHDFGKTKTSVGLGGVVELILKFNFRLFSSYT